MVKPKPVSPYEAIKALTNAPHLTLTKQVDKLFAVAGNELTYTLIYSNTGSSDAANVVIANDLPAELGPDSGEKGRSRTNQIDLRKTLLGDFESKHAIKFLGLGLSLWGIGMRVY